MKKILLNYEYQYYPFTTASYLEMAGQRIKGLKMFRLGQIKPKDVDLIINVMPCAKIVSAPPVPSCYWEIDAHIIKGEKTDLYPRINHVFIAQKPFLKYYPKAATSYLPLACDPILHARQKVAKEFFDIGFIGNDTYPERRTLLNQLSTKFEVLTGNTKPGLAYSRALSECKMIFNKSLNQDVNMRFFEAISIGRLLLTDYLPAQDEFAKEGQHYVAYKDWPDLAQKVQYYLEHEAERERIAIIGSNHVKRYHTYEARLKKIIEVMKCKKS